MSRQALNNLARILPILAAILFFLPSLWTSPEPPAPNQTDSAMMRTSAVLIYLFAIWLGMILLCILAYARRPKDPEIDSTDGGA